MCTLMMQTNTVACSGPSAPPVTIKRSVVATQRDGQHKHKSSAEPKEVKVLTKSACEIQR